MRGKYDAILLWPFRRTVTFRLIDQQENPDYREDVVKDLDLSDDDSDSELWPRTEENRGYGFPKFISHDKIRRRRYIVNDTAYLEVQVSAPSRLWSIYFSRCIVTFCIGLSYLYNDPGWF